jgi:hypothetical protein
MAARHRVRDWIIAAVTVGAMALCAACGGGGGSGIPLAVPQNVTAEPGDTEIELSWSPVAGARSYTVYWGDASTPVGQSLPNRAINLSSTQWKHGGLVNLQTYRYRVVAVRGRRQGSESVEVTAEPGPVPAAVEWAVVVTGSGENSIHFSPATEADRYRVYYAESANGLGGRRPAANFIEAAGSPVLHVPSNPARAVYYRVIGMNGMRIGRGGYPAVSTVFDIRDATVPDVTPALWDVDGDGCLDMVGANGDCAGGFQSYPLESRGLAGLFATGRVNRDSRFADFNNDGLVDIFTNVYSRADDPASRAILHINDGNGIFREDAGIAAMEIGGFGETVLAADFDNDDDLDIFVPHYWHRDDGGHSWLLINDGHGSFTDRAEAAGVARGPPLAPYIPEGAAAIDFNEDGWIDIHVASALYINNGDGTFTDRAAEYNLPIRFDEGMRFTDVDADGDFDLIQKDSFITKIFRNEAGVFDAGTELAGGPARITFGYGLTVCDVNGDGFDDVLVAINDSTTIAGSPHLLINVHGQLVPSDIGTFTEAYVDLLTCADLNRDGLNDVLARWGAYRTMINMAASAAFIKLRVVGANGQRNQQGRVIRIRPAAVESMQMVRIVESGSGYMAQGDYDLLIGAPWEGDYEVSVRFRSGWVNATVRQGQVVTMYEDNRLVMGLN